MFLQPVYDNGTILISSAVVSLAGEVAGTVGTGATAVSSTWFPCASVPVTASLELWDGCTFPVSDTVPEFCAGDIGMIFSAAVFVSSTVFSYCIISYTDTIFIFKVKMST